MRSSRGSGRSGATAAPASSNTSSSISASSSTSDPAVAGRGGAATATPPGAVARLGGLVRLTHPFPSLLDGGATLAIALLAGGRPLDALGLAIANALADVERDRAAGVRSVAAQLGSASAWTAHAMLQATVVAVAVASLVGAGATLVSVLGAAVATVILFGGVRLARSSSPA